MHLLSLLHAHISFIYIYLPILQHYHTFHRIFYGTTLIRYYYENSPSYDLGESYNILDTSYHLPILLVY